MRNFIKPVSTLAIAMSLTGCSIIPGMHMKTTGLTKSLNNQGQLVEPKIMEITPQVIQKMDQIQAVKTQLAIKNYKKPTGFTTNTQGYHYLVGPQDILNIIVWDHPNLSNPTNAQNINQQSSGIIVDKDGYIYYPYVGKVKVAGLSTDQIRDILAKKLAAYIKMPQLNVQVIKFNSQSINVTGAVGKPTVLPVTNVPMTLLNAITAAGGAIQCGASAKSASSGGATSVCANLQHITIERNKTKTTVNLNTLKAIDGSSANWILQNDDIVHVPTNNKYRIFILGSVYSAGPYNMVDGHMTLKEALGDAGGVTNLSDPTYTYVIRNYKHNPSIYELDAKSPDAFNLAADFELQPEDVVFVSTSKIQTFNEVLNEFTPSLTTAVYVKTLSQW